MSPLAGSKAKPLKVKEQKNFLSSLDLEDIMKEQSMQADFKEQRRKKVEEEMERRKKKKKKDERHRTKEGAKKRKMKH